MGDKSNIEWTDATWNPIVGCSIVSKGCTNCYAMKTAGARTVHTAKYQGLTKPSNAGPVWTGEVRLWERALTDPLKWRNARRVFVNSMGDLFHEDVPDDWIDRCFAVMALCPAHTFQVLTKRPERMRAYIGARSKPDVHGYPAEDVRVMITARHGQRDGSGKPLYCREIAWPLPNVWLGVSCEDQATADERIPLLLETPAAVRFISAEPLLGPIDLERIPSPVIEPEDVGYYHSALERGDIHYREGAPEVLTGRRIIDAVDGPLMERLDWVIAGGESGPHARPFAFEWADSIIDQCRGAGVPCFVKQLGTVPMWMAHPYQLDDRKGGDWVEWPERLRVRQYPTARAA